MIALPDFLWYNEVMVITPQTNIRLLKCVLEEDNLNQLDFANVEEQSAYFLDLPFKQLTGATYQRKEGIIRYNGQFDELINYNYCMYQNEAYSDKWFYAFITNIEYINDQTTNIYIKTDVFQTWQFNLNYLPTFVEREHVNDDTPGKHTLPEGLELGEPVVNRPDNGDFNVTYGSNPLYNYLQIAFQVTELIGNMKRPVTSIAGDIPIYNGLFSGLYFFAAPSPAEAQKVIAAYAGEGKADAITAMFLIPEQLASGISQDVNVNSKTFKINWVISNDGPNTLHEGFVTKPRTVGDAGNPYTPRNKKLLTYPYSYLYASNFSGQDTVYRWEDWSDADGADFISYGSISQGCSIRLVPQNYKTTDNSNSLSSYGLTGGKLPVLAWATDYYTNWLTQNAINIGVSHAENGVGIVSSLFQGDIGGVISGVMGVGKTLAQQETMKIIPDTSNGQVNCGDINIGLRHVGFSLTSMSIRKEYAEIIDKFFDMFGYKVSTVKIPNIHTRTNWNYIKTIDCYIEADIPQEDLLEIKGMFNRGFTIWHNPVTFMNYNLNNGVIQ